MAAAEREVEFLNWRLDELIDKLKDNDGERLALLQEIRQVEAEIRKVNGAPRFIDWLLNSQPNRYDIALMVVAAAFSIGMIVGMAMKWL